MASTTIQFRTDSVTKKRAQKIAEDIGMDISTVLNSTLKQMIRLKGLPFTPRTANGFTEAQEDEMIRRTDEARKYGKGYTSAAEMHAAIMRGE